MGPDDEERPVVVPSQPGDHMLERKYCLWFMQRETSARGAVAAEAYEKSIKPIGEFESMEGFWTLYNQIKRPNDIELQTELHMFRAGIKPIWEDKNNEKGGKLTIRLVKGLASYVWEAVLLGILGEQFDSADDICGAVISIRTSEDVLAIWNRNADAPAQINRIRESLKSLLDLPSAVRADYKRHDKRLRGAPRAGPSGHNHDA